MTTTAPDAPTPRFPLRLKLGALTAVLACAPLPAVGLFLLMRSEDALRDQVHSFQLAVADDVSASLEGELTQVEDGLDAVGRMLMSDALDEEAAIAASMHTIEGIGALDHVAVYDAEGALVDVVRELGAPDPNLPPTLSSSLRQTAADQGVALSEVSVGDVAPRLTIAIPMRPAPTAPPTAFAASRVSLERLQIYLERVASHRLEASSGSVLVIDTAGALVAHSAGLDGAGGRPASHPLIESLEIGELETAFATQRLYERGGAERLGTLASVPGRRWAVIVEVPAAVALAPVRQLRGAVWIATAVVTLLALGLGLWVARSITRPIDALVGLAQRLGRRELGATVTIATSDELSTLGNALSQASLDLEASVARIQQEEAIRADLGRYLPAEIVERVVQREQDMALGGTRREITVLFADVVRFTPLTEDQEPEVVVSILNELFTILTEIVFRHGGTVDKFIGDCVMAMWNAPEDQPDHAARALTAAEDMMRWLETGNLGWKETYGVEIQLAIGVHTGEAVVGNVGSESRMAYTAIGEVVNIASRLEAIARPQQILVTEATRAAAGDGFELVDAGERGIAGRTEPIHLYEVQA